ncbi:MAG TPA: hypothetical protein VMG60_02585 [Burkholderiaceae bacterium]|nr:hypothetical protein [Burkholderiaceae bacterium]
MFGLLEPARQLPRQAARVRAHELHDRVPLGYVLLEIADRYSKLDTSYPGPSKRAPADVLARGGKLANEGDPTRDRLHCARRELQMFERAVTAELRMNAPDARA